MAEVLAAARIGLFALLLVVAAPAVGASRSGAVQPLLDAIERDDPAAAAIALAGGADANAVLDYGETPLARAVETQDPALVATLLQGGARPDQADATGLTPLALACERGHAGIVLALLAARANPRQPSAEGTLPLSLCARFAPVEAVRALIAAGAEPDRPDRRGQTALMWAASAGQAESVAALVASGANVNRVTVQGFTPLFFAIAGGNPVAVQALIAAGADPRYRGPEQTSALQLALYQKAWRTAALLIGPDTALEEIDRTGQRPLHVASGAGDAALVAALLAAGADPNGLTGPSRITWVTEANFGVPPPPVPPTPPLLIAARAGQVETMRLLVAAGANRGFVAADGSNVVLTAAAGRSAAALAYALELAPGANVANGRKATPLHLLLGGAFHPELPAMFRVLADRGARTDLPDASGQTAIRLAEDALALVQGAFRAAFPG